MATASSSEHPHGLPAVGLGIPIAVLPSARPAPCLQCTAHLPHHVFIGLDSGLLAGNLIKLAREGPSAARGQDKMREGQDLTQTKKKDEGRARQA